LDLEKNTLQLKDEKSRNFSASDTSVLSISMDILHHKQERGEDL